MCISIFQLTIIAYLLNIIGLIFDMYGVYKLFYIKDKGIEKIDTDKILTESPVVPKENPPAADRILDNLWLRDKTPIEMFNVLNIRIEESKLYNQLLVKKSTKWIRYIIAGFLMSVLSVLLQLVCYYQTNI